MNLKNRAADTFFDGRYGDPADLLGENEKQLRIPHLTGNFDDAFEVTFLGTADNQAVFKNLVFTRRWDTQRHESVMLIE